jgi:hypothetical protein
MEEFESFSSAKRWMDENYDKFRDLLRSDPEEAAENSESGEEADEDDDGDECDRKCTKQKTSKRPIRKRKAPEIYSPENVIVKAKKTNNVENSKVSKSIEAEFDAEQFANSQPSNPDHPDYEDELLKNQYVIEKTTFHEEALREKVRKEANNQKAEPSFRKLKNAMNRDIIAMNKKAKKDLGVMSLEMESPNIDGCKTPEPSTPGYTMTQVEENDLEEPLISNDDASEKHNTGFVEETAIDAVVSVKRNDVNEDRLCENIASKLIPILKEWLLTDKDDVWEKIASKVTTLIAKGVPNMYEPFSDLSRNAEFLIGDSVEFGLPVIGRHAAKQLDHLLLRNPTKLKVFVSKMYIMYYS